MTASYVVTEIKIIDSTKQDISIHSDQDELKLVTCFPFDGIVAGGPLRYVVTAKLI
jgi:sortase A